jgi:hypothetical protein
MLKGNVFLDLIEFSLHPWISGVPIGVEAGKGSETFFGFAMIDEPSIRALLV